ncbi:hypothetical protein MNBD_GAMMA09-1447 [hydrothermal vent metagenome]|uniref:Mce/MlaD domain-containing protein n=1 Tax=hydrothermal vent metagenome TaxID=652676 RepID=A0A3B0YE00_9ZZZZ
MKKDNINYFMVGLFVIAGLLLLFVMLFKITGNQSDNDKYYVVFDNVTGIKDGIVVTFGGYAIGLVNGVEPLPVDNNIRYRVSLLIKSGWKIPEDSKAKIVMPAIISDKQIEITQGNMTTHLSPGDIIPSVEAVDIMLLVDSIAQQINQFVPESTKSINQMLGQMNYSVNQVAMLLNKNNIAHLNNVFKNADVSSRRLADLASSFSRLNRQLDSILNKSELLIDDNSEDIRYTIVEMKKSIDEVSGRIESVMYNLDATSQNMNEFSRTLRNNPGAILGSKPPEDKHSD